MDAQPAFGGDYSGRRRGNILSASDNAAVFLSFAAGGQRLYVQGGVCNGRVFKKGGP